tara:strand:+ start:986 stop:1171 length:186 start_codon:yes stop_codon:yes gene_type:complete
MRDVIRRLNQALDTLTDVTKRNQIKIDLLILKVCTDKMIVDMTLAKYSVFREEKNNKTKQK